MKSMKKLEVIFVLFLLTSTQVLSQSISTYDFKTKVPSPIGTVPLGQNALYKIENINTLLYEVTIESKQTDFHSETPAIFGQILKLEEKAKTLLGSELEESIKNITDEVTTANIFNESQAEANLSFNQKMIENFESDLLGQKAKPLGQQDSLKIVALETKIRKLRAEVALQKNLVDSLKLIISDDYAKILQGLFSAAIKVSKSFDLLEETKSLKNKLVNLSLEDGLTFQESSAKAQKLLSQFQFVNSLSSLSKSFERDYQEFLSLYYVYLSSDVVKAKFKSDTSKIKESVHVITKEMESLKANYEKTNYPEIFDNIDSLQDILAKESIYLVVSDPVQAEKDIVNFSIKITPRKDIKVKSGLQTRNFSATLPVVGGKKIDFSTGLILTHFLHDRSYSIIPSTSDSGMACIVQDKNNNITRLNLGAFMHLSNRVNKDCKLAFSLGLGLKSTDLNDANVFLGASLVVGTAERFIFTGGLALAPVDYLKGSLETGKNYQRSSIPESLTVKTMLPGAFLGFSYNLTNKKKE
jgi:hypothetical protein